MSLEIAIKKKLNGFTLEVEFNNENQRLGILGASGSGKSLTLKCIAGIEHPDEGRIVLNQRVLFDAQRGINLSPQKRKVGYLFQSYALFPAMTVEENIGIAIKAPKEEKRRRIAEKIAEYRLDGLRKRYPSELSGGQQQRVALARMLVSDPDIIMLDEPFSALDSYLRDVLQQQLLESLVDYRGDVLMVTHNRDEVYRFCERLLIVSQGRAVTSGDTEEVFRRPVKMEAARLTGCKNLSPIKRIDSHTMEVLHWGIRLYTEGEIPEGIGYVGIRAHDFIPRWDRPEKNFIPFQLSGRGSLPFEEQFFLKPATESLEEQLCYIVPRNRIEELEQRGMPGYLYLPEEKLLLLE